MAITSPYLTNFGIIKPVWFNLPMLLVSQESGVSLTTLYKIRKNSFGDISKIPSAKIRNKLVKYLQEKENKANK